MRHPISTFARFMYLNAYAFLLLMVGVGIALIPVWKAGGWWVLLQAIPVLFCWRVAWRIFSTWEDKKRKYNLLMERNKKEFRADTFTEYMQAPCGKLLTKVVLRDMGHPEKYKELKKLQLPLLERLRKECKPQKTTIYVNKEFLQSQENTRK